MCKMLGCFFHYGQRLFRNFVRVGLKKQYSEDENLRKWFKKVLALAFVPLDAFDIVFGALMNKAHLAFNDQLAYFMNDFSEDSKKKSK